MFTRDSNYLTKNFLNFHKVGKLSNAAVSWKVNMHYVNMQHVKCTHLKKMAFKKTNKKKKKHTDRPLI